MSDMHDLAQADPKGLIRESFRIDGITASECRSIFVDWALSLPPGVDPGAAMRLLIATYAPASSTAQDAHPMVAVLTEGADQQSGNAPRRRGGRAARFAE